MAVINAKTSATIAANDLARNDRAMNDARAKSTLKLKLF